MSLNVLNHLGINLYSNVPAVLSEIIANSYDADAEEVSVEWNQEEKFISVHDNGYGMTEEEVNDKYLNVGYQKRNKEAITSKGRKVMGRKGIGKLSVFSIAEIVDVYTTKEGENSSFRMSVNDIKSSIGELDGTYYPTEIPYDSSVKGGTKIVLRELKKNMTSMQEDALRKRVARRFSVIGGELDTYKSSVPFSVKINGKEITPSDRDYYDKIELCYLYEGCNSEGEEGESENRAKTTVISNNIKKVKRKSGFGKYNITGWIGTARKSSDLNRDGNINKIVLFVRGKVAQEDILSSYNIGSMYARYVFGEIHADFLDEDEEEDIAVSSRQGIFEDDDRFKKLKEFVKSELDSLKKDWEEFRAEEGSKEALEIPAVKKWFEELGRGEKQKAKSLLGKISRISDSDQGRNLLIKHTVLAFETMRYQNKLDIIEEVSDDNVEALLRAFREYDTIEASMYHQIAKGRVKIIEDLEKKSQ